MANVENYLKLKEKSLPVKAISPFTTDYMPEIDVTHELDVAKAAHYQSLISVVRWIVELGRGDIATEPSILAFCMVLPR